MEVDCGIPVETGNSSLSKQSQKNLLNNSCPDADRKKKITWSLLPIAVSFLLATTAAFLCCFIENDGATAMFSVFSESGAEWLTDEPVVAKLLFTVGVTFLGLASLFVGMSFFTLLAFLIDGDNRNITANDDRDFERGFVIDALKAIVYTIFVSAARIIKSIIEIKRNGPGPDSDDDAHDTEGDVDTSGSKDGGNLTADPDRDYERGFVIDALKAIVYTIFVSAARIIKSIIEIKRNGPGPDSDDDAHDTERDVDTSGSKDGGNLTADPDRDYERGFVIDALKAIVYTIFVSAARIIKSIIEIKRNGPGPSDSKFDKVGTPAYLQLAVVFIIATLKYDGLQNQPEYTGVSSSTILTLGSGLVLANFLTSQNLKNDPDRDYERGFVIDAMKAIVYTILVSAARIIKSIIEIKRNGPGPVDFSTFDVVAVLLYGAILYPSAKKKLKNTEGWYSGIVIVYLMMILKSIIITMGRVFEEVVKLISRNGPTDVDFSIGSVVLLMCLYVSLSVYLYFTLGQAVRLSRNGPTDVDFSIGSVVLLICLYVSLSVYLILYFGTSRKATAKSVTGNEDRDYERGFVIDALKAIVYTIFVSAARIIKSIIEIKRNGPGPSMDVFNALAILGYLFMLLSYKSSSTKSVSVMQIATAILGVLAYAIMEMTGVTLHRSALLFLVPCCGALMAISISEKNVKASNYFSILSNYGIFVISTLVFIASTHMSTMTEQVLFVAGYMFAVGCASQVCQTFFAPLSTQSPSLLQASSAFVIVYMAQRILSSLSFVANAAFSESSSIVSWISEHTSVAIVGLLACYLFCGTFAFIGFTSPFAWASCITKTDVMDGKCTRIFSTMLGPSFRVLSKLSGRAGNTDPLTTFMLSVMAIMKQIPVILTVVLGGILGAVVMQSEIEEFIGFVEGSSVASLFVMSAIFSVTPIICLTSNIPIMGCSMMLSMKFGISVAVTSTFLALALGNSFGSLVCYTIGSCLKYPNSSFDDNRSFNIMTALNLSSISKQQGLLSYSAGITGVGIVPFARSLVTSLSKLLLVAMCGAHFGDYVTIGSTTNGNLMILMFSLGFVFVPLLGQCLLNKELKTFSTRSIYESKSGNHELKV
eukprot:CAMPEP_0194399606 /NCGR_PEP_ID=MMETSP0174-20130528/126751_1 /TAXON_ID=216777 /ORGANISM="Proboscia alata, Strain PI-D3" /LENGTH=1100 /DNA_ID=CAMNT_0039196031 /DNA_START=130 /DNA_END=3433 /DNA_ORIENTATION=+